MNRPFVLFISCLLLLASCKESAIFDSSYDIKGEEWSIDSLARFHIHVADTISPHHIFVNIRNTTAYPYSNLFLFIHTTSPSGASLRDTMECILADNKGNWMGKGFGALRDNRMVYKRYIRFPEQGIFTIDVVHGMRTKNLKGIASMGIRIEKAE